MSGNAIAPKRYARVRVSFVRKRYTTTRIAPISVRSTSMKRSQISDSPLLRNDRLLSTRNKLSRPNSILKSNRTQITKPFSCQQKLMLFTLLFTALLILTTFILPYIRIYFLSQKVTFLMELTQTTISEVSNHKYHCGGITTSPSWGVLNSNTLSLTVDTSSCKFNSIPLYFTSISGTGLHYGLASYTAIYGSSTTSFTIYVTSLFSWNVVQMLNYTIIGEWSVNWLGISY